MKRRLLFILCFILGVGNLAFAQRKTVTNADLEKYRQKRVAAEKDYRENYEKMGFPSPEELDRQIEESRIRNLELSEQFRQERKQNEGDWAARASALRAEIASAAAQVNYLRAQLPVFSPLIAGRIAVTTSAGGYYGGSPRSFRGGTKINLGSTRIRVQTTPRFISPGNTYAPYGVGRMAQTRAGYAATGGYVPYTNYRRGYGNPRGYGYGLGYYPAIIDNTDYAQQDLVLRIQDAEQRYAGLLAEWRALEEEARRAGIKID